MTDAKSRLERLREPFPPELVGKLPKLTCKACSDAAKNHQGACGQHSMKKCKDCGNYITTAHLHLDYVGHAQATRRLLDVDPEWNWEPQALNGQGLPAVDDNGGLWIRLTVGGVTRLGYGDAQGKRGPNAVKEAIGDAIRNAAMRFGLALDLWSKERDDYIERPGKPSAEAGPDPRQALWLDIAKKGEAAGMSEQEMRDDFASWSEGKQIDAPTTTADELVRYFQQMPKPKTEGS